MCLQKGPLKGGEGSREEEEEEERAADAFFFFFPRAPQRLIRSQMRVQNISCSVVEKEKKKKRKNTQLRLVLSVFLIIN